MRLWARARGRNCSPSPTHPRRQLMWTPGLMATTSGSAWTLCMGHSGKSCCQTTFSGSRRGNGADGSMVASVVWCGSLLAAERQERSWLMRSSPGLPSYTVAWSSRWCRLCTGAACQSWRLLEEFLVLRGGLVAHFALGICAIFPCPSIWQSLFRASGVLLMSTKNWILGRCLFRVCNTSFDCGYMFFEGLGRIYIFSTMR